VMINLLRNAVDASLETGGGVAVSWKRHGGQLEISVEDEGPGPSSADSEAIFARFRRGAGEEPEPGGLGLGLWIVKSIIDRHSGTIALTRTEQGRTRFVMTLPAEKAG